MEMNVGRSFGRGRSIRPAGLEMYQVKNEPFDPIPGSSGLNPYLVNEVFCGQDVTPSSAAVDIREKMAELMFVNDPPSSIGISGETGEPVELLSTMEFKLEYEEMIDELLANDSSELEENPVGQEETASINHVNLEMILAPREEERAAVEGPPAKKSRKARQGRTESKPRSLESKLMKVRPARRIASRQVVPEGEKTAEYYEHRRKNTEAARKCRENKRAIDEKRVEMIKALQKEIEMLRAQIAKITHENEVLLKMWGPKKRQPSRQRRGRGARK